MNSKQYEALSAGLKVAENIAPQELSPLQTQDLHKARLVLTDLAILVSDNPQPAPEVRQNSRLTIKIDEATDRIAEHLTAVVEAIRDVEAAVRGRA